MSRKSFRAFQGLTVFGVLLALAIAGLAGCWGPKTTTTGGNSGTQQPAANDPHRVGTVTTAGGSFEKHGVKIVFPAGAVRGDIPLSIALLNEQEPSPDQNEFLASPTYRLNAANPGTDLFGADVEVTLPYDPTRLPAGFDEANLRPMWWTGHDYRPVERFSVDRARHEVKFFARHFSDHAVGGDKAPAVPPPNWQPKHPELPVEIRVVETYLTEVTPEYLDQVEEHLAYAYDAITAGKPYRYLPPGRGPGGKLVVIVTDIAKKNGLERLGVASTPTRLKVRHNLPADKLKDTVVHEFFHCVQFTHFERTLVAKGETFLTGAGDRFEWLDEATAEWMVTELGLGNGGYARPDFCFEELTYISRPGAPFDLPPRRKESLLHKYSSAIFIKFLVEQYGQEIVPDLLDAAFGPEFFHTPQLLMDHVIRQRAPKAGQVGENLYSTYARFVMEHLFKKEGFGNWDANQWKLGPRRELNLPSDAERRPTEVKLTRGQEFSQKIPGLSCEVPALFVFSREEIGYDDQLELSLVSTGKPSHEPPVWLHVFTQIGRGGSFSPRTTAGSQAVVDLNAKVEEQVLVIPVSLEIQALELKAKLKPRQQPTFAGNWAGKSTRKGLGRLDYIARIGHWPDNSWSVYCGDLSALTYAHGSRGCKVVVKGETLTATLIDDTSLEGQKVTFTFEATLYGNQLNGTEKCETEFSDGTPKRTDWETSFMLNRKP